MNDRLRLRFWDKEECQYLKPSFFDSIWFDKDGGIHIGCYSDIVGKVVDYTNEVDIEQCTGLKDKNGNLIYENDRVGFYVYGQDEEWHAQQGTVIWYNSCWGIETSSRFIQFENELTIKNPKDIEIIGNVHEQAEQKD